MVIVVVGIVVVGLLVIVVIIVGRPETQLYSLVKIGSTISDI